MPNALLLILLSPSCSKCESRTSVVCASHRSADVEVPLTPSDGPQGLHGSVLGSGQAREWLQFVMGRQPKDALLYLRKWVKEAAKKEGVQLKSGRSKLTGRSTSQPSKTSNYSIHSIPVHMTRTPLQHICGEWLPVISSEALYMLYNGSR